MRTAGLIVAAGRGRRLGADRPKQYERLGGATVLGLAARALLACERLDALLVVIHPEDREAYAEAAAAFADPRLLAPAIGRDTRADSVLAGLEALADRAPETVLIHDAARPFLPRAVIDRVLAALEAAPGACPVLPVVDALWREEAGRAGAAVDRSTLRRAQTPQGFRFDAILAAHRARRGEAADDVAVARAAGLEVRLVEGAEEACKITTAADLVRARRDLGEDTGAGTQAGPMDAPISTPMDVRTGNGFDVHAFGPGDGVTLCGVRIPHDRGLVGHSDADVGMHALTDAILGALAEGDIGRWFPPSDPRWKGADSAIFLRAAAGRAAGAGFAITHLDCTLVCEAPKIGPHAEAMRAALSAASGVAPARISVKATTSERLGFTGRGEGIAALATATLVRP